MVNFDIIFSIMAINIPIYVLYFIIVALIYLLIAICIVGDSNNGNVKEYFHDKLIHLINLRFCSLMSKELKNGKNNIFKCCDLLETNITFPFIKDFNSSEQIHKLLSKGDVDTFLIVLSVRKEKLPSFGIYDDTVFYEPDLEYYNKCISLVNDNFDKICKIGTIILYCFPLIIELIFFLNDKVIFI